MKRRQILQAVLTMRFEEAYEGWDQKQYTQEEAARLLGVSDRTFRRYISRYEEAGLSGLVDRRVEQRVHHGASLDEILALQDLYSSRYAGWNMRHFFRFYQRDHQGARSYSWIRKTLQKNGVVAKSTLKGKHRQKRERAPLEGMMLHQDGSTHEWVPGVYWDLIVTMDDATSTHYSMFFCEEEGTASSFQGIQETIRAQGLFCALYTDRGSHYWYTPEADGKVDKTHQTQVRRALTHLGIEMIPAYSPEARGRSERAFGTHQGRLPQELALRGIQTMAEANRYLREVYLPEFNVEFSVPASCEGRAFVPWMGGPLEDILCEHSPRVVGKDNCVRFEGMTLQIPKTQDRCQYIKANVRVHRYPHGGLALFYGPKKLADYNSTGSLLSEPLVDKTPIVDKLPNLDRSKTLKPVISV